ncbi:GNAT family N-acetyltransferase [Paenibacillus barcinonensis]|uniref:GNAT family N-acetyltransferase n=1 Tax=Paenibacillus barcinonensis TaxID=198119 RepID=UPI001C10ECE3|nr:GNAT family protein [Paenibacillus barcinonensis]MBU5351151.1 GNAT family N-acetyltransferase [Paenibacillus barcinonensis]
MSRLYGERIVLREYQNADLEYMKNGVNDPNITANLSDNFLYPHSSYATESFFKTMVEGKSANKSFVIGELEVYEYNQAAHKCYLKCGFQEEGRYRKKIYKNGTYWDSIVMSILKNEYEK